MGDWNALPEGPYQVYIYANDTYSYLNDTLILTLFKDINNPAVFIHSVDNDTYHNTAPFINVSFSDFNYDSLWYEISGVSYVLPNYTNHQINAGAWTSQGQGRIRIYIFANDTGGNVNNSFLFVFYKDTQAPIIIINFPANGSHFTSAPVMNIDVSDPNLNILWYEFEGVIYEFLNGVNKQINPTVWAGLATGVYYVYIYANDTFGYQTTPEILTIYKDEGGTDGAPPFDPMLLIILLIIIGIIAIVAIVFIRTRGNKKPQGLQIKAKRKRTSEFKGTTQVKTPKPKPKVSEAAGEALSSTELAAINAETQKTREEMLIEEKEDICPVHKGPIVGINYSCPKCKTKYCMKCARTLVQKNEGCWACNDPISFMDEDLNHL